MAIYLKRKIYNELIKWKEDINKVPLIVTGLKEVGKSFVVNKFAHENYENVIVFDFRHYKELREIFDGNLDVDSIVLKSSLYFKDASFVPYKTVLVFEEIGDCPLARTSLKSFALDKRYDVIGTSSSLGLSNYRRKRIASVPTGYEKVIQMTSLDFEEFLWANGVKESDINLIKNHSKNFEEVPNSIADFYKEMMKRYIVVGGMPEAVKKFVDSKNILESRKYLEQLINDYRSDFGRYIDDNNKENVDYKIQSKLNQLFDSIPSQLAKENQIIKFKFSDVKKGGRSKEFEDAFEWLNKAGLVLRCFNVRVVETPLEANTDKTYFKAFLSDIGLLLAMYPLSISIELLNETLGSRKGAIYENLIATMINKLGFPLYYFSNGTDHLEIDFLLEGKDGIILLEEKSTNGKMAASKAIMKNLTPYKASKCYKVIQTNFGDGDFFVSIPQFATPFVLEGIKEELETATILKPLVYPSL